VSAERIGLLHPGEMGAAIGAALVGSGRTVRWASDTLAAAGLPAGFHEAAAELYGRPERAVNAAVDDATLSAVMHSLLAIPSIER